MLPHDTAGQIAALLKKGRMQENCPIEISVPTKTGDVLLRETLSPDELDQVFTLVYQVYVDEMGIVPACELSWNQAEAKQKFDTFDFAPYTRHLVAVHENRVVGCLRLVDEIAGTVPIERNGFSLEGERLRQRQIRECSKLIIQPSYRGTRLCMEFFKLAFLICRTIDNVDTVYLSCEPRLEPLYAVINGVRIGQFENAEFGRLYSIMRIDVANSWSEQLKTKRSCQPEAQLQ
jgi:N-acyl-L-homoserine lactone synthetase